MRTIGSMLKVRALVCEGAALSLQNAVAYGSSSCLARATPHAAIRSPLLCSSWMTYSSSSGNTEGVERMLDFIANTPQLQQMMMSALPKHMQRPEVIKGILENPEIKKKVAEMVAKQGIGLPPGVLGMMDQQRINQTLEQSRSMGLDPSTMFQKLMSRPGLMKKFRDPRVVSAFLEIAQDQSKLAKYQHDQEVIEVWFEAKDIMLPDLKDSSTTQSTQAASDASGPTVTIIPPPTASTSTQSEAPFQYTAQGTYASSSPSAATSSSDVAADPSQSAQADARLQDAGLQQLMSDPARLARLAEAGANPRVQKALMEISKSKWKVLRYLFDKEVMAALKDLGEVAKETADRGQQK